MEVARIGAPCRPDLGHDPHHTHPRRRCALRVCICTFPNYFLTTSNITQERMYDMFRYRYFGLYPVERALCRFVPSSCVRACHTLTYFSPHHKHLQTPLSSDTQKLSLTTPLLQGLSPVTGLLSCASALCTGGNDSLTDPFPAQTSPREHTSFLYCLAIMSSTRSGPFFRCAHLLLLNVMHAAPH